MVAESVTISLVLLGPSVAVTRNRKYIVVNIFESKYSLITKLSLLCNIARQKFI